jgi:hypothetical protein
MSKALPVIIGFMASLLGLGGITGKIQDIIKRVKQPIEKAIDWVIAQAVKFAKKIGNKLGFGKDKKSNKDDGKPDERTKEEKQTDLDKAMKEAKTYLDGFSGKEVNKQTIKSKLNNIKETYALKSLEPVEKGIHWGIRGEVNPTSEADSQAELSEQEKRKVIAKALNANEDQILDQLHQDSKSRNQTRNETLTQLRTMDKNSPPEFEGYILDSILEENRQAFRSIKSLLAEESPDV